ncbi:MAG TPA: phosphoribosylamine--glycine ligase [Candidatus Acidoferrales bacterium]|nr:phosphoribosylamine--glycine ligase [Candidatus Acidoferrales bacterium]
MKILIIGGGGREHAMAWKLRESARVEKIWCAPGNGGISRDAECVPLNVGDPEAAADLAVRLGADLTIVGPELPLVEGIADEFKRRGLAILGPPKTAARLEGSKIFAKEFMRRNGIPTAGVYGTFASAPEACAKLDSVSWPVVVKADGLCAGKGVLVTSSPSEAKQFIERLTEGGEFGDAGKRVLLEEGIAGRELSYIILTDGTNFISLAPVRDHKRAFDDDEGPNTGGMGTYSADGMLTSELEEQILGTIVRPTLAGLRQEKMEYRGFIFFGLMLTKEGVKVLEYNCRLGDPETQAILLRADFDFATACMDAAQGRLDGESAKWKPGASLCVVIASEGYPSSPVLGKPIGGLEAAEKVPQAAVFHAGTRREGDHYYSSGGRILGVAALGRSLAEAHRTAYGAASRIIISGAHYRKDIGVADVEKLKIAEVRASR